MATDAISVCAVNDIESGSVKEFKVLGKSILVAREGDRFFAVNNKCSHYGASLATGSYCNGRIRCPWHGAVFSVESGDIEDYPGFESLYSFQTHVTNGNVYVTVNDKEQLAKPNREKTCNIKEIKGNTVVIIGSGAAGAICASTLRENDFKGPIIIVTKDPYLPYDRPKLSKALSAEIEKILLKPSAYYEQAGIVVKLNTEVVDVDANERFVICLNGDKIKYNYLVVASGGEPRRLHCVGADSCEAIFYLRNPDDAHALNAAVNDKRLLIVGSSFIGMELASALVSKAASVSVTAPDSPPFKRVFGAEIGQAVQSLFEAKKILFYLGHGVPKELRRKELGYELRLGDGTTIEFDVMAVGVGVTPATKFLNTTPVMMTDQGQVKVDATMLTSDKHIYACGDIVAFPLGAPLVEENVKINIQHWQIALKHGKIAGLHIARRDKSTDLPLTGIHTRTVPFFWTTLFGKSIRFTGFSHGHQHLILSGDVAKLNFVAYFIKDDHVVAVATCQQDPVAAHFANIYYSGVAVPALTAQKIADDKDVSDAHFWAKYLHDHCKTANITKP